MKGLYLSNLDGGKAVGYQSKILGQIHGLIQNGLEFELIYFARSGQVILQENPVGSSPALVLKQASSNLLLRRKRLLDAALERIKEASIDVLYIRYPRSDPMYLFFLYRVKNLYSNIQVFCEFPTFPYDQEKPARGRLKHTLIQFLDRGTRNFLKYFVDRIVAVNYSGQILGIQSIEIVNGISIASFSPRKAKNRSDNNTVHLLGVANVKAWHGYDRIISGLGNYYRDHQRKPKVAFHIVGACEPMLGELQRLASHLSVDKHVFFYHPMQNTELDQLFDLCDVGVSTLAAHRIGLQELSPLKSREYCARGMPFLLGYSDPDFIDKFKYAYQLPAIDSPVDIEAVLNFTEDIYSDQHSSIKIRKYAESHLDWSIKMAAVAHEMNNLGASSDDSQ